MEEQIQKLNNIITLKKEDISDIEITGIQGIQGVQGIPGEKGEPGKDGENYILTLKDKKEIAENIEVPIVEKIEVIREIPIITNEIKEVAKYETGDEIIFKINNSEEFIKKERIADLVDYTDEIKTLQNRTQLLLQISTQRTNATSSGGGTPGGSDTQVQFNDGGSFGGDAHFYYNKTTDVLHVHGLSGDATDGLLIESDNGTDIAIMGAANTANVTWYGNHNFGGTLIQPTTNDVASLGAPGNAWSDLFLASGGIINFNASDVLITHSSNKLTLSGGSWDINNASGFTARNGASDGYSFTQANTNSWIFTPLTANSFLTFASSHLGLTDYVNVYTNGTTATFQRTSDSTDLLTLNYSSGAMELLYSTFKAPTLVSSGGTTSAPGMTFSGDTNTGLYGNGSGAWGLTNDGTTSIYGNASANVHIGGTSPLSGYKLTVTGNQYIDGQLDTEKLGYNSIRSLFGERGIFINEFEDVLWRANRRFTFTSSYGGSSPANMFDGDYETTYVIPVSTTDVMNINVANQSGVPANGITYPEGKFYVHFYYTSHQYQSISARTKMNGVWYALPAPTDISTDNVNKVLEFTISSNNYLTDIELTVTTDGTNAVWITGLNYILTRWTSETEPPYVDKYQNTNRLNGDLYFLDTVGATKSYISNTTGDNYFLGKLGVGTASPGTYYLNVAGNILGNDIVTNSGSVFRSLGVAYLRANGTSAIHIGDSASQLIDLGVGGGAVSINKDASNVPSGEKLMITANSATTSANILRLSGSATGFSGANDTGSYSLVFDGCAYQTSIVQVVGGKIEFTKANTWNYADTPTGTRSIINFYASAGTPDSPTLIKFLSGYWDNTVRLPSLDTDATAPTTSGTTKMVITDANGQLSFTDIVTLSTLGVTASAAELNILDGATLTTTELNYVDGVTSAIQTQLDAKLALAGGTMTGNITLGENASIDLDPAGSADGKYTGIAITGTAGAALAFGDLIYLDPTDSRWELADANAASGADGDARGILGICVLAAAGDGSATKILLNGVVRADTAFPAFTVNNPIYVSETAGDVTQTQPTTTDVVIRILGSALTADEMYFNPDWAWATHT